MGKGARKRFKSRNDNGANNKKNEALGTTRNLNIKRGALSRGQKKRRRKVQSRQDKKAFVALLSKTAATTELRNKLYGLSGFVGLVESLDNENNSNGSYYGEMDETKGNKQKQSMKKQRHHGKIAHRGDTGQANDPDNSKRRSTGKKPSTAATSKMITTKQRTEKSRREESRREVEGFSQIIGHPIFVQNPGKSVEEHLKKCFAIDSKNRQ
eukprot:g2370.t1